VWSTIRGLSLDERAPIGAGILLLTPTQRFVLGYPETSRKAGLALLQCIRLWQTE